MGTSSGNQHRCSHGSKAIPGSARVSRARLTVRDRAFNLSLFSSERCNPETSALIDTRVIYCGDNLDQLRKLPDGHVLGKPVPLFPRIEVPTAATEK